MYGRQWHDISMDEMKTTPPRTLISYMNTHVNRWKTNYAAVQRVIDALPPSADQTAEHLADGNKDRTDSENDE